jgi:hypothetical protein
MEEWNNSAAICYWQYILGFYFQQDFFGFFSKTKTKKKKKKKKHTHTHTHTHIAVCHWYDKE